MILTQLEKFCQTVYDCLGKAKDAVFELMDAVLTSPSIPSFVSLSQSPVSVDHKLFPEGRWLESFVVNDTFYQLLFKQVGGRL